MRQGSGFPYGAFRPRFPYEVVANQQYQRIRNAAAMLRGGSGISADLEKVVDLPGILIKALLVPGDNSREGQLIEAVAFPWFEIIDLILKDPAAIYQIPPRTWEEIIAGAYRRAGCDEVILTPRSGDDGRDVIAELHGIGHIRIVDQVKAYAANHVVTADEVRSLIGVLAADQNVSKGVITTTSDFAPGIYTNRKLQAFVPNRLELKNKDALITWLDSLTAQHNPPARA